MEKIVAASILGIENKKDKVNELIAKGVNWIHYDVMDGIFVKNKSIPIEEYDFVVNNTNEHIKDVHLMVADPLKYINLYKDKADYISFHYEAESIDNMRKIFKKYMGKAKLGIAINPKTNVEQIYEFLHDVSFVLVMSVVPGLGGQSFIPESADKIKKLQEYINKLKLNVFLQVDGGINDQTGPIASNAGVSVLVSGSFLMKNIDDKLIQNKIIGKK